MVTTTFQNPACSFPLGQQNIPPSRETTLCLVNNKMMVLGKNNNSGQTRNQRWSYLSNINPPKGRTYAVQNDLGSNPNTHNLTRSSGGGLIETCEY